jgi:two-component system nitrogen regulation sensor histidine kinase NtrY
MVRNQKHIDHQELRRRKRERIIIVMTIVVIFVLTLLENRIFQKEAIVPVSNNILVFGLININIILILLLVFLIVRNVVKLIFERRHGVLGSKLRTKLVAAFVSLSLIPTAILFLVAVNFLSYSIENWFNITIGDSLNKTVEIAQVYYQQTSDHAKFYARQISSDITKNRLYDRTREEYLKALIDQRQRTYKLGLLEIYFNNQKDKLIVKDQNHPDISPGPLSPKMLEDVFSGQEISAVHPLGTGDLISGLTPIYSHFSPTEVIGVAVVSYYIPKSLVDKISVISKTSEQYKQLSLLKNPIKFSYMITLFIVALLIVFSATWFGLFLLRGEISNTRSISLPTMK